MGAAALVARAEIRRRWRWLLALGLLTGLVAATVLACVAGARRTSSVPRRLTEVSREWDALLQSWSIGAEVEAADQLMAAAKEMPGVEQSALIANPVGRVLGTLDWFYPFALADADAFFRPPLVAGRWATAADEIVVSQATADQAGYSLGDVVPYQLYAPGQLDAVLHDNTVLPTGARFDLRVVGVFRGLADASTTIQKVVLGGPSLFDALREGGAFPGLLVRLADRTSTEAFTEQVFTYAAAAGLVGDDQLFVEVSDNRAEDDYRSPVDVMANGMLLVAAIVAVVGVALLAQAVGRHMATSSTDDDTLAALGLTRAARIGAAVLGVVPAAAVAGLVAVAGAVSLSPLFPLGSLHRLEPSPGLDLDPAVLTLGALAVAAGFTLVAALLATTRTLRARRRRQKPSAAVSMLARTGASPASVAGASFALVPGRGRRSVPVRSAVAGAALGIVGVIGALVVGVNLDRLVETPERYGAPIDLGLELPGQEQRADVLETLVADPDVTAAGFIISTSLAIGPQEVGAYAIDDPSGDVGFTTLRGRAPGSEAEVGLGPELASELGVGIGESLDVAVPGQQPKPFTVVGHVLTAFDGGDQYAGQLAFTPEGLTRLGLSTGQAEVSVEAGLVLRPGADVRAVYDRLDHQYPAEVQDEAFVLRPGPIDVLARTAVLPWIVAIVVGLAAIAALAHALAVGVHRRAPDLGVLRAFGATSNDSATTLRWMAATVVGLGLAVGLPLGLAIGAALWRRIAEGAHVSPDVLLPLPALAAVIAVTLLAAVVIAIPAGRRASRLRVADVLHSE
jgi:hypothetical protein